MYDILCYTKRMHLFGKGGMKMDEMIDDTIKFFYHDLFNPELTSANLLHKIVLSLIILVVAIWLYKLIKGMMNQFIRNIKIRTLLQVTTRNIILVIATLLLLSTWVNVKNSVLLVLIVLGGMMVFSIKNLSNNLVAWLMLLRKKYFKLYDRIEINDMSGDVVKITPFYFKMIERGNSLSSSTATGRVIHVPNHLLLNNKLYNYNQLLPINWKEVSFKITVDSNWEKALAMVEKEGNQYLRHFLDQYTEDQLAEFRAKAALFDEELILKTYVLLEDDAIKIVAQFPVHYTKGTSTQSTLNKKIITRLNDLPNVEMHSITTHVHIDNFHE